MSEPTHSAQPPIRRRAVLLTKWQRANASLLGLCATGAGGTAVFLTDNQAGSTTLLVLGGLGLLIGMTGRVPDRIGAEGLNFDPVDPATAAVENVLADNEVPLDTKETIAAAVKEEMDRRQLAASASSSRSPRSDRLSYQADAVLFEARVRNVIRLAVPESDFITTMPAGDIVVDGIIERPEPSGSGALKRIVIETTFGQDIARRFRSNLPKIAALQPEGLIYVVDGHYRSPESMGRLRKAYSEAASRFGIPNAHLVFFDESDEASSFDLAAAVRRAWDAL